MGLIRALPRHAASGQRDALAAEGLVVVHDLGEVSRVDVLDTLRRGDHVYVLHLHLLAERTSRTDWNPRRDLAEWVLWLIERGAIIVELSTGRRADTRKVEAVPVLLAMLFDAIEAIVRGGRGRAIRIAQQNGSKSPGRPRKDRSATEAAARAIYFNQQFAGKRLAAELRRIGWTVKRCWEKWGGRYGQK